MRFVQGLLLGIATGCAVGFAADLLRPFSLVAALFVLLLLWIVSGPARAGRRQTARRRTADPRPAARPHAPTVPGGFFAGRRLGDALAWLATEHGVGTLERVGVTEDDVVVLFPGPQGPRLAVVTGDGTGFAVQFPEVPDDHAGPLVGAGRFQARDLAPDVLPRALERARREHPATWTDVQDAEALVHRPDRLRDDVTVLLHNGAPTGADQTLWASASGDLLYVQESLS